MNSATRSPASQNSRDIVECFVVSAMYTIASKASSYSVCLKNWSIIAGLASPSVLGEQSSGSISRMRCSSVSKFTGLQFVKSDNCYDDPNRTQDLKLRAATKRFWVDHLLSDVGRVKRLEASEKRTCLRHHKFPLFIRRRPKSRLRILNRLDVACITSSFHILRCNVSLRQSLLGENTSPKHIWN